MQIDAVVYDSATNQPLPGASILIAGKPGGTVADSNGEFLISDPSLTDDDALQVSYVGYTPAVLYISDIENATGPDNLPVIYLTRAAVNMPSVTVTAKKSNYTIPLLAGAVLLLFVGKDKKKKRTVSGIPPKDIVMYAVAGGAVYLIYQITKGLGSGVQAVSTGLGLSDSQARTNMDAAYSSGNYPLFSNYYDKVSGSVPDGSPIFTVEALAPLVAQLQVARGILTEDTESAKAVFTNFKTQLQIAEFAKVFQSDTGEDLFTFMRKDDSLFSQGFAATTVASIMQYINGLPPY